MVGHWVREAKSPYAAIMRLKKEEQQRKQKDLGVFVCVYVCEVCGVDWDPVAKLLFYSSHIGPNWSSLVTIGVLKCYFRMKPRACDTLRQYWNCSKTKLEKVRLCVVVIWPCQVVHPGSAQKKRGVRCWWFVLQFFLFSFWTSACPVRCSLSVGGLCRKWWGPMVWSVAYVQTSLLDANCDWYYCRHQKKRVWNWEWKLYLKRCEVEFHFHLVTNLAVRSLNFCAKWIKRDLHNIVRYEPELNPLQSWICDDKKKFEQAKNFSSSLSVRSFNRFFQTNPLVSNGSSEILPNGDEIRIPIAQERKIWCRKSFFLWNVFTGGNRFSDRTGAFT